MSGPIFGLRSEHLSVVFRGIGFIRSQTRRNATTSTIAEANIGLFLSALVNHRLLSDWNVPVPCGVNNSRLQERGFVYNFCYFAPVTRHSVKTMCTMFYRKDFFGLFDVLLRISTRKTNAEPRCLTSLGGAICAAKHLELVHAYLASPYTDLTNSIWGTKY